ncbi:hypothetical protein KIH31_06970 [Paenarthrobacter sp. DKR-5]|uniref:hypothetical protein n=1 Tax=Paenarthrobacter sp. DKR-5 TaxID=2835535 RepID=UPI001BDBF612|nr:hypothetical protein [Paenarthrobacter sp. DKR-5]MBT1002341.1 hypothetical protein [Paenarthrobacter sp. DKR-5]
MQSLGSESTGTRRRGGLFGASTGISVGVLALVFLVALVFAANHNDVLGWFIAIIAAGWLALSVIVVVGIRRAAKAGAAQLAGMQQSFRQAAGIGGATAGTTQLVDESVTREAGIRDQKLEHSFKIVQVQARVISEQLGGQADRETVDRALETIQITASNAMAMLKDDDGGPVSGTVVG